MRKPSVVRRKWNLTENKLDGGMNLLNIHQRQKKKKWKDFQKMRYLGFIKLKRAVVKLFMKPKNTLKRSDLLISTIWIKKIIQKSRKDIKENGNNCAKNHNEKLCLTNET